MDISVGPPACAGRIESYGFGCPGSGEALPVLSVGGCASDGETIDLHLSGGLGGAVGALLVGLRPAAIIIDAGCALRVDPIVATIAPLVLDGSGAGAGRFSSPIHVPIGVAPANLVLQFAILDPGTPRGWSASNGVSVTIR